MKMWRVDGIWEWAKEKKRKERGEGAVAIRDCMKWGWSACGTGGQIKSEWECRGKERMKLIIKGKKRKKKVYSWFMRLISLRVCRDSGFWWLLMCTAICGSLGGECGCKEGWCNGDRCDKNTIVPWQREEAAGILLKSLSHMQYVHIEGTMHDPIKMWKRLRTAHWLQVMTIRFHTMQKLLSIWKEDSESLTDYVTRINSTTNDLIALAFSMLTIQNIIDEIGIHTAIVGLDQTEYGAFTSSLLLIGMLDCTTLSTAFRNEDLRHQANITSSASGALSTARGRKGVITTCTVCKKWGPTSDWCWIAHPELKPMRKGEESKKEKKVNQAIENALADALQKFARNTSLRSSLPSASSNNANLCWNTDMGATSHMTPHHHWLRNYEHYCVPIWLVTNDILYSAGRGQVLFAPKIVGWASQNIMFSQVLHVSDHQNYSTCCTSSHHPSQLFSQHCEGSYFIHPGWETTFLCSHAKWNRISNWEHHPKSRICSYCFLTCHGLATPAQATSAYWPGMPWTAPEAWHGWCICITSYMIIPTICEPCIAVKQHCSPFSKKSVSCSLNPLDLVVSDVHGPLPVCTLSGYWYWITFTDDCTRYRCVHLLKNERWSMSLWSTGREPGEFESEMVQRWQRGGVHWPQVGPTLPASKHSAWTHYERHTSTKWDLRADELNSHWRNSRNATASPPTSIDVGWSTEATNQNHHCHSDFHTHRQDAIQGLVQPQTELENATHIWLHCPHSCSKGQKKWTTAQLLQMHMPWFWRWL